MMGAPENLIVCTTVYPGSEPFLRDWYVSLQRQTDSAYALWIALDGLTAEQVCDCFGDTPDATWVAAHAGDTPAAIRQQVLSQAVTASDGIVLVDSDDILHPQRVADARRGLMQSDLVACALQLVDQYGRDLGRKLSLASGADPDRVLPRHNIFGLSNTAWRSTLLQRCLPVPAEVEIVDWYLATRAWLIGARLAFEPSIGMDYRQHASNMVRVCAPFNRDQVMRDAERVRRHFRLLHGAVPVDALGARLAELNAVADEVERFAAWAVAAPGLLDRYIQELNALDPAPVWWSSVAHPSYKQLWSA